MGKTIDLNNESAPVTAAIVFRDCAEVHRRMCGVVEPSDLTEGSIVTFKINLRKQEIRCFQGIRIVEARGVATILEVSAGSEDTTENTQIDDNPKAKILYTQLCDLLREKSKLCCAISEGDACKSVLRAMRENVVHPRAGPLSTLASLDGASSSSLLQNVLQLSDDVTAKIIALEERSVERNIDLKDVDQRYQKLTKEIEDLTGFYLSDDFGNAEVFQKLSEKIRCPVSRVNNYVKLKCDVAKPGDLDIVFAYTTAAARWDPDYHLKTSLNDHTVTQLTYFGLVKQWTGDDWKNIRLTLSTGAPSLSGCPKSLPPLTAKFAHVRPMNNRLHAAAVRSGGELSGSSMRVEADACMPKMRAAVMDVDEGQANASYTMSGSYCVPSDGEEHKITIGHCKLETLRYYHALPESCQTVYRAARLRNSSKMHLLPSSTISIFMDNLYLGKSEIGCVPPGADFQTYFGREDKILLETQPLKRYRKTAGNMFTGGATDKETFEHAGWVQNLMNEPIVLSVAFRLPRSCEETIKVTLDPIMGRPIVMQCQSDLEILGHPSVPTLSSRAPTITVVNEPTDHCVLLYYLEKEQKARIICSYTIERPTKMPIEVTSEDAD